MIRRRPAGPALLVGPAALLLALLVVLPAPTPARAVPTEEAPAPVQAGRVEAPPNVVLITTDDMRADDLAVMPHTRRLLGRLVLTDFVANHPLCCPARAELLTGQLAQHNGVHHNSGPHGGYQALRHKRHTVAAWFDRAGYETSAVGKFVNGWESLRWPVPRGWDHFSALVRREYAGYGYTAWTDGVTARPRRHVNDFVTKQTVQRLTAAAAQGRPFFHWASYPAPHTSNYLVRGREKWLKWPTPARRHRDLFARRAAPSAGEPAYVDVPEQRWAESHRMRLRSLQSVDEGVRRIVAAAARAGVLDRTVLVFTSDNGYLLGEHGLRGKNNPYEESLRVPLLATGPGVDAGRSDKGAMTTDIAPSLAALAGVTPQLDVDGRSDLFRLDGDGALGWPDLPIQAGTDDVRRAWGWRGVRTPRWTYVEYTDGRRLLLDRREDPQQLRNRAGHRPRVERRLADRVPPAR